MGYMRVPRHINIQQPSQSVIVCIWVCVCVWGGVCMCVWVREHICICVWVHVGVCVCLCVCVSPCGCVCVFVCVFFLCLFVRWHVWVFLFMAKLHGIISNSVQWYAYAAKRAQTLGSMRVPMHLYKQWAFLSMCVFIWVYVCVCVFVCESVCVCVCGGELLYMCVCVHMFLCLSECVCVCFCV